MISAGRLLSLCAAQRRNEPLPAAIWTAAATLPGRQEMRAVARRLKRTSSGYRMRRLLRQLQRVPLESLIWQVAPGHIHSGANPRRHLRQVHPLVAQIRRGAG